LGRDLADWVPNTVGRMNLGYARYMAEDSLVDSFSWTLGAGHDFSERMRLSADAGVRYTISRFEVQGVEFVPPPVFFRIVSEQREQSGLGGVLKLALSYRWERTNARLGFQHDLMTASGRDGPTERTGLTFDLEHRLTEKLWGKLNASFFLNRAEAEEFGTEQIDEQAFTLRPAVRWEISDKFSLEASYTYSRVHDLVDATATSRNLFSMRLTFGHDLLKR
jgi:opacity protein-like surface antigen